jgi:hypothetical protein
VSEQVQALTRFVEYAKTLDGYERGEAQVFCDRLFKAFGHDGYKEAGASLEFKLKSTKAASSSFADLVWKPRLLLEMKSAGENLHNHYQQAFDYWINSVPDRPRYVVLCNFREFWIYDFDKQMGEPVDRLTLEELRAAIPPSTSYLSKRESLSSTMTAKPSPERRLTKWRSFSSD